MTEAAARTSGDAAFAALEALGIQEPWQCALLMPSGYEDVTQPDLPAACVPDDVPAAIRLRVESPVSTSASKGVPRASCMVSDVTGARLRATAFGNPKQWAALLVPGTSHLLLAQARSFKHETSLVLKAHVEPMYDGRVRPVYAVRKTGLPESLVRAMVVRAAIEHLDKACAFVRTTLGDLAPIERILARVGCEGWDLEQVIEQVPLPLTPRYAQVARTAFLRLAALAALMRLRPASDTPSLEPMPLHTLQQRIDRLPFTLTGDQARAVREIAAHLARPVPLRHVLSGDVGTGKTYAASVIAGCVVDAKPGNRVLVMVPNVPLCAQFRDEFLRACPDVSTALVTGDCAEEGHEEAQVVFGTSAVLSRDLGTFALVIVDEQQRWAVAQREHYVRQSTHLLELSATCIPRTLALMKFGRITVSELRQTHKPKRLHTRLWEGEAGLRRLFQGVRSVVEQGRPVVVVYPKREVTGKKQQKGHVDDRHSIEAAFPRWEAQFPGLVRCVTSDDENDAKREAIEAIESGKARILLCTLVVEVGLNVRGLRNMVVVHPDRFGLPTLHQLRGRLAREGGDGFCDLLQPEPMSDKARERVMAFLSTTDGFVLSGLDLKLRGTGDLGARSKSQSGADKTFLFGVPLTADLLDEVLPVWEAFGGAKLPSIA